MKIKSIALIASIVFCLSSASAQSDLCFSKKGREGVFIISSIDGGEQLKKSSPDGNDEVLGFKRGNAKYSSIMFDAPGAIDLSGKGVFTARIYMEDPQKTITNNNITLILREDGEGATQLAKGVAVEKYDEWVTYTWDFTQVPKNADYNQIGLFFNIPDDGTAAGAQYFIDEIRGPGIISNNIFFIGETGTDGTSVLLKIKSKASLKSIAKKATFKVGINGRNYTIKKIEKGERTIELKLPAGTMVTKGDKITVSYTKGEVIDEEGKKLPYFVNEPIVNLMESFNELWINTNASINKAGNLIPYNGEHSTSAMDPSGIPGRTNMFTRGSSTYAGVIIQLDDQVSVRKDKEFNIAIYAPSTNKGETSKNVLLILRNGSDVENQLVVNREIKVFDQWVEYNFDFSSKISSETSYDTVILDFASPDENGSTEGFNYYWDNLKGPKLN